MTAKEREQARFAEIIERIETRPRMAFKKGCTVMPIDRGK